MGLERGFRFWLEFYMGFGRGLMRRLWPMGRLEQERHIPWRDLSTINRTNRGGLSLDALKKYSTTSRT
jgi:hypothetical protein